jgi:hypothetical protein
MIADSRAFTLIDVLKQQAGEIGHIEAGRAPGRAARRP